MAAARIGMRTRTGAAAITAAVAATVAGCSGSSEPLSTSAEVMCEDFVKERLTSPGTADFPGPLDSDYATTEVLSHTKPWKYRVTGVVDSQNGFGATVRSDYVCTVSTKDDDTWILDDMQLAQR